MNLEFIVDLFLSSSPFLLLSIYYLESRMSRSTESKCVLKRDDGQIVTLPDTLGIDEYLTSHVETRDLKCECHNINWGYPLKNGGICEYTYPDGSIHEQCVMKRPEYGLPCGDKVQIGLISREEFNKVCRYRLRDSNCQLSADLQEDLLWFLCSCTGNTYDERFDEKHPNHYKKYYKSVREMIQESDKNLEDSM